LPLSQVSFALMTVDTCHATCSSSCISYNFISNHNLI